MSSLTLVSVRLVSAFMRRAALPRCNSARASLSVHTRSEVVSGRFTTAATQSFTPPGWMDTGPEMYLMRTARLGDRQTRRARPARGRARAGMTSEQAAGKFSSAWPSRAGVLGAGSQAGARAATLSSETRHLDHSCGVEPV